MDSEIQPGDRCARCGGVVREVRIDVGTVDSAFDEYEVKLTCDCQGMDEGPVASLP